MFGHSSGSETRAGKGIEDLYVGLASVLLLALVAALMIAEPFSPRPLRYPHFDLKAMETDGRLRIDWDPSSRAVTDADSAALDAIDGGTLHHYQVDRKILGQGGLEYRPRSTDLFLRLSLLRDGKVLSQGSVRLLGRGGSGAASNVNPAATTAR